MARNPPVRSSDLIFIDPVALNAADGPAEARLGDAQRLQGLREPTPRLDLAPRHILQQRRPKTWSARLRRLAQAASGAVAVHVGFAAAFFFLLSFRDVEIPRPPAMAIEVTVVTEKAPPEPHARPVAPGSDGQEAAAMSPNGADNRVPGPQPPSPSRAEAAGPAPSAAEPGPKDALKPDRDAPRSEAPPRRPSLPPGDTNSRPAPPSGGGAQQQARLVAPPPDAPRAATQDRDNKPANLQPEDQQRDLATREAKPVAVPRALATSSPDAGFTVPPPAAPKAEPIDKPAPPIPATAPSATEKLAAALPMDTSAMPMSFRAVMAGNATAQINATYANVVQGRMRQAQAELAETAYAEHLSGYVALRFSVDDAGKLGGLSVVQSSGNARLDALALHALASVSPFPPPPPEAEHTFNKAFLIGR